MHSITGELGHSLGFIIIPSLAAYERFLRAAERLPQEPAGGPVDLGASTLALNFEPASELPASMRIETATGGWPVATAHAYPRIMHRERDGVPRQLVERDVQVVTACAAGLAGFLGRPRALFAAAAPRPVSEMYKVEECLAVRITPPFPQDPSRAASAPPVRAQPAVSRNAPCPCDSGNKYKKCCLPLEEARHRTVRRFTR